MKNKIWEISVVVVLLLLCMESTAQSFLGLSINYGDKLTFTPNYPTLLSERRSLSPTLVYSLQKKFKSDFAVIFGGQAGITSYYLVPVIGDTISSSVDRYPFIDYGIFVSRIEVTSGKIFHIGKKELFVGLGVGISYYLVFPYTTMNVLIADQGTTYEVFSAYIESSESGVFAGFAKIYMQMNVSKRIDLAFQYSRHWKSILNGEFEFYHTKTPASGTIELVPQGISLMLLYRLKTKK